jgi:hypothetical protein
MSDFFSGYDPTIENRDEIRATSIELGFRVGDYEAPEEIDFRKLIRHDDQGRMNSCGAFGNTNCGEGLWALSHGAISEERQFSPTFSYIETQRRDGNGLFGVDRGSTVSGGLWVSTNTGYLPYKHLPYRTPYPSNAKTLITDEMRTLASPFKIRSHTWLESYDAIKNYMAAGVGLCFVGTLWNQSFYSQNKVLESVNLRSGGGHAYCFAGYSKRKDSKGQNYIWRLNSHGNDSWTEISPEVIDQLCRHEYTSIVGVSDLSTPGPRAVSWMQARPLG